MVGIAYHGNTPFDVPFISEILPGFWQGGCETGLVLPDHIDHLVSLYPWEQYKVRHELQSEMYVRAYDSTSEGPDMERVIQIAEWVNHCRQSGTVLVHCQAGLNRSGFVAAVALMIEGMSADEAIALLRDKRSPAVLCNPAFEDSLRSWDLTHP